jgi:hypothetical protein
MAAAPSLEPYSERELHLALLRGDAAWVASQARDGSGRALDSSAAAPGAATNESVARAPQRRRKEGEEEEEEEEEEGGEEEESEGVAEVD